jgi:hypothetical protein
MIIGGLTINFEHNQKFLARQHFILTEPQGDGWNKLNTKVKDPTPSIQPKLDSMKHNMPISLHHLCATISHWRLYIYIYICSPLSQVTEMRNQTRKS